jgi:hypothetical protein
MHGSGLAVEGVIPSPTILVSVIINVIQILALVTFSTVAKKYV